MMSADARRQGIVTELEEGLITRQELLADEESLSWIVEVAGAMAECLRHGGKVMFAGNGGSFADAQHLSAELVGRFMKERGPFASVCLGANSSLLTAIGNDYGYDLSFARELEGIGRSGDVLVVLSTSGNSKNILAAVSAAVKVGVQAYGLAGATGGALADACLTLRVPSQSTPRIQETHIAIGHIVCGLVEEALLSSDG